VGVGGARLALFLAAVTAVAVAGCSPASPPPSAQRSLSGPVNQSLVVAQAHLAGEASRYGNVAWVRQPDEGDVAIFLLAPGQNTPTVTARIKGEAIAEFIETGALSHATLAGLASAAGAPAGEHGPTADKIEGVIAVAKATGQEASLVEGKATYAAAPSGQVVTARLAP
jgi:hypothetical protein